MPLSKKYLNTRPQYTQEEFVVKQKQENENLKKVRTFFNSKVNNNRLLKNYFGVKLNATELNLKNISNNENNILKDFNDLNRLKIILFDIDIPDGNMSDFSKYTNQIYKTEKNDTSFSCKNGAKIRYFNKEPKLYIGKMIINNGSIYGIEMPDTERYLFINNFSTENNFSEINVFNNSTNSFLFPLKSIFV